MKSTFRAPVHPPVPSRSFPVEPDEDDADRFVNRPCYEFNHQLLPSWNDKHCAHCRHYLTARCPHIDEFLDDVEDLTPE
ncbi:MAG TPA: hypothetical protein VMC82_03210 [Thermoplasmata archaeon]|nr:hypothetical protein [Thermoplasmata archaeon]